MIRQGDVLLVPVGEIPEGLKARRGNIVLATGEATGHAHKIVSEAATLYGEELNERFLEVVGDIAVEMVHTSTPVEHAPILVEPGRYQVRRQREYTPEEARWVND